MSDSSAIAALTEQGKQTQRELAGLSQATTMMAQSISELTTMLARVEERHSSQDEMVRRIGKESDDHETRIRALEKVTNPEQVAKNDERITQLEQSRDKIAGGWKALSLVAGGAAGATALVLNLLKAGI